MHQYVLHFGDDVDSGMAKFKYTRSEYKLRPISEIVKDPCYLAYIAELPEADVDPTKAFLYIRHRLKECGPVLIVDKESHKYFIDQIRDAEIETIIMLNEKGVMCRVELLTDDPNGNKWDWWVVGGRWNKQLLVKPNAFRFEPHNSEDSMKILNTYFDNTVLAGKEQQETFSPLNKVKHLRENCAYLKDIDFEKVVDILTSFYSEVYTLIREIFTAEQISKHKDFDICKDYNEWVTQSTVSKIKEKFKDHQYNAWTSYDSNLIDNALKNNEAWINDSAKQFIVPGAFTYLGKWYDKYDLFGQHLSTKDADGKYMFLEPSERQKRDKEMNDKWVEFFFNFIKAIEPDTKVTVVDIHY